MPYALTSAEGGQSFELRLGSSLIIGRALTSDIPVFDPTISRRHAEVTYDDAAGGVAVRDLGSSNGTFVNGARVQQSRLSAGDIVSFGRVSFRLTERAAGFSGAGGRVVSGSRTGGARAGEGAGAGASRAPDRSASATTPGRGAGGRGKRDGEAVGGDPTATIVRRVRVPETGLWMPAGGLAAALRHTPALGSARIEPPAVPLAAPPSAAPPSGAGAADAATGVARTSPGTATPARHDPARNEQKLAILLEVSKGLTRVVDVGALLDTIVGFCLQIFDVDYVSVLLADERGELVPTVARDRHGLAPHRSVPQSIARSAIQERVAILSDNATEDARFGSESILAQRVRSTMCAPLIGGDRRVLGVLYVDNVTSTHRVDEEDLEFLAAFASIAAVAIENGQFSERIRHEMLIRSNFERYFAPNLAAQIAGATRTVRLGGEKRPVAVLFSDIRDFTVLSESMRPDDMASLLSEYFTEMVECVFRHGGTLDKFMGDAVMAQWGAPIGTADDADRAVQAAIDMMRALEGLNARWRGEGRPALGIGVGLSYGEAFAGNIGSERRLEFTVIGDTVNTASRLCASADAGQILLSDAIRRALRRPPPLEECPPLELKGKAQPVPVYRVVLEALDAAGASRPPTAGSPVL